MPVTRGGLCPRFRIKLLLVLLPLVGLGRFGLAQIPVTDTGPLPRHHMENVHVMGLLDHSNFTFLGRSNPQGPYDLDSRSWTDVYGYVYDGVDLAYQGRRYAYVSTGGFGTTGNFGATHQGGVAIFDVTATADPDYLGTYVPPCSNCRVRDVEIHDGVGYFSSDRTSASRGGVFVVDLRPDPANPTFLAHLNSTNFNGLNDVHEIGVDFIGTGEAFLYAIDSSSSGEITVYDIGDARTQIQKVDDITGVATHGVFAKDGVLYVAGGGTVSIFDVSDVINGNSAFLGQFSTPGGFTHSVWPDQYVDGAGELRNVVYVTHESGGTDLQVWDVTEIVDGSSSSAAMLIATVTKTQLANTQGTGPVTNAHNVFLVGDILFSSWTAAGLVVMDVSDPENPQVIDTFDTNTTEAASNFVGDFGVNPSAGFDRVLVSDRSTGLWVVDISAVVSIPAGAVPDGASVPGTLLTIERAPGDQVTLSWGESCSSDDSDYAIYEGTMIGDFTSHEPKFCSTGGATTKTFAPGPGNVYYIVVALSATREGTYGTDSAGTPRPQGLSFCLLQEVRFCGP